MTWQKVKLGDVCKYVTSGGTPLASRADFYNPGTIPWLKTKEVNYSRITKTENFISELGLANSSAKLIPENSVIVAMYGQGDTAGRVAINKIPLTTNQACCNFIIDEEKADYNFIYYNLCTLYEKMVSLKNGGAQPNLNAGKLKELEIKLPSLATQQKIADILSAYDNLIENNQKQIKLLEEAAQRLYKQWFIDLRFPGHETTQIVDGLPEGWHYGSITEISTCYDSKRKPLSSKEREAQKKIYPYYGAASLMDYVEKFIFDGVYLLFGEDGTVITNDETPMLQYVWGKFWVNNHAHIFQGANGFSTEFLYMLCKHLKIKDVVTGVAQPKISQGRLNDKKIVIPSQIMAAKYSELTCAIFKQIRLLSDGINVSKESRDRLLPKLMNNEIEV